MVAAQGQGNVRPGNEHRMTGTFGCWRSSHTGLFAEPGGFPEISRWLSAARPPVIIAHASHAPRRGARRRIFAHAGCPWRRAVVLRRRIRLSGIPPGCDLDSRSSIPAVGAALDRRLISATAPRSADDGRGPAVWLPTCWQCLNCGRSVPARDSRCGPLRANRDGALRSAFHAASHGQQVRPCHTPGCPRPARGCLTLGATETTGVALLGVTGVALRCGIAYSPTGELLFAAASCCSKSAGAQMGIGLCAKPLGSRLTIASSPASAAQAIWRLSS